MEVLNQDAWARRESYEMFSRMEYPFYSVTIPVDVTKVKEVSKKRGVSFYLLMVWTCTKAVNSVFEFRLRIRGSEICIIDRTDPSFTYLPEGEETFKIVTVPWEADCQAFCRKAKTQAMQQTCFIEGKKRRMS